VTRSLPRRIARAVRRRLSRSRSAPPPAPIEFTGDYASWAEAKRDSDGYESPVILERTTSALLKVKRGEAVYERDSVILDHPEYPFPVVAALLRAAVEGHGRLSVLDFGGSLGSTYFQCRRLLGSVPDIEWLVVEQPGHVARGRELFEGDGLRFFETADACVARHRPNVLLLSGVLQCLPNPYDALRALLKHGIPHLIIDRTAFFTSDRDRLTVQTVPEWIYPASYPAWFLSETKLTQAITGAGYGLVADFKGTDDLSPKDAPGSGYYKGFIFDKRDPGAPLA
jgi:putative methyltransferase (TIGR04325 family)